MLAAVVLHTLTQLQIMLLAVLFAPVTMPAMPNWASAPAEQIKGKSWNARGSPASTSTLRGSNGSESASGFPVWMAESATG